MKLLVLEDEKRLLSKLRQGDHDAFQSLYDQYAPIIYSRIKNLIHHQEWIEELHQDVFLKIWENRSRIDDNLPFKAILFRTARSLAIDFYRKALRDKEMREQLLLIASERYTADIFLSENNEINKALYLAIENLPPKRKKILSMIKLEGKKYEEVAQELGISLSTVKDHMAKAMTYLRAELTKQHPSILLIVFMIEVYQEFT